MIWVAWFFAGGFLCNSLPHLAAGLVLLSLQPVSIGLNAPFVIVIAGALAIGVYLALHFGKVLR